MQKEEPKKEHIEIGNDAALKSQETSHQENLLTLQINIETAKKILLSSLTEFENSYRLCKIIATFCGIMGIGIILTDLYIIYSILHDILRNPGNILRDISEDEAIILVYFPLLGMIFSFIISLFLFRHQKKLLNDIRYFANIRHQVRVFCNVLDASQYITDNNDSKEILNYMKQTFTILREKILLIGLSQENDSSSDDSSLNKLIDAFSQIGQKAFSNISNNK